MLIIYLTILYLQYVITTNYLTTQTFYIEKFPLKNEWEKCKFGVNYGILGHYHKWFIKSEFLPKIFCQAFLKMS